VPGQPNPGKIITGLDEWSAGVFIMLFL
jgi:hypothetical protein